MKPTSNNTAEIIKLDDYKDQFGNIKRIKSDKAKVVNDIWDWRRYTQEPPVGIEVPSGYTLSWTNPETGRVGIVSYA